MKARGPPFRGGGERGGVPLKPHDAILLGAAVVVAVHALLAAGRVLRASDVV